MVSLLPSGKNLPFSTIAGNTCLGVMDVKVASRVLSAVADSKVPFDFCGSQAINWLLFTIQRASQSYTFGPTELFLTLAALHKLKWRHLFRQLNLLAPLMNPQQLSTCLHVAEMCMFLPYTKHTKSLRQVTLAMTGRMSSDERSAVAKDMAGLGQQLHSWWPEFLAACKLPSSDEAAPLQAFGFGAGEASSSGDASRPVFTLLSQLSEYGSSSRFVQDLCTESARQAKPTV